MKTDGFLGLTSLLKGAKDILWVGSASESPPNINSYLFKRIKYVSYSAASKSVKNWTTLTVVSLRDHQVDFGQLTKSLGEISGHIILLLPDNASPEFWLNTIRSFSGKKIFKILKWPSEEPQLERFIDEALKLIDREKKDNEALTQEMDLQSKLELENTTLEEIAKQEKENLEKARRETDQNIRRTKNLARFVKDVSSVVDVDSLLKLLRNEIKLFHHIKEPILGFTDSQGRLQLYFFQGSDVLGKTVSRVWPQGLKNRLNDVKDSQYLADIFGRPFAKLLTIPLLLWREIKGESLRVPAVLFFEHALGKDEVTQFLQFIDDRLQPLSIAIDRLMLEIELVNSSLLWEKTFDGIHDPIAIFDMNGNLVRGNKAFSLHLADVQDSHFPDGPFRHNDKYYEVHSYPIQFGKSGQPTNVIVHFVDVTVSQRLQKQIVLNEKMAALGHLAGNIAHELNNPLTGVRSLAQVLLQKVPPSTPIQSDLQEVEKAAERCQIIIQNLLDFSSGGVGEKQKAVSFRDVVEKTMPLLKTAMRSFETEFRLGESQDTVFVEPHLLQQVVFNVIKNACQAMGEKGRLVIEMKSLRKDLGEGETEYVVLSVKDSGAGIPKEIREQIFDFFFTTKSQGQGTGLGLSMSKNIVDRFGGRITVESEVGQGSEFLIWLPFYANSNH